MKKRTLLIPAAIMTLSSCVSSEADLRNTYKNMDDCLKDNNPVEIQKAICDSMKITNEQSCEKSQPIADVSKKYQCTEIDNFEEKIVVGPEFPSQYYEKSEQKSGGSSGSGFIMGYWLGRSLTGAGVASSYSSGVYHKASAQKFTHSSFKQAGGSQVISRGGFGASGRGSSVGS